MPRDGFGNYTLPALGNPAVTNTPITIAWWNGTSTDMATAFTDSLSRNGQGGMLASLYAYDGAAGLPGITFSNESTVGFYHPTGVSGEFNVAVGGNRISRWTAAGFQSSFDNGATWKNPLYNNNGNQTFTGGLDFTSPLLTVDGQPVLTSGLAATVSSSCGTYFTANASATDVTNLSVTATTTGKSVCMVVIPDGTTNAAFVTCAAASGTPIWRLTASGGVNCDWSGLVGTTNKLPLTFSCIQTGLSAGSHTFKMQVRSNGADNITVNNYKLVVYEI